MNRIKLKYSFLVMLILVIFQNCKKDDQRPLDKSVFEFQSTPDSYWKVTYFNSSGISGEFKDVCDSVFFSPETIELNIISNGYADTSRCVFHILQAKRRVTYYDSTGWYNFPVANYGVYRMDSSGYKVIGVHTVDLKHTDITDSTSNYFREFTLFDFYLKSGSDATVRTTKGVFECVGFTGKTNISGYAITKQSFTPFNTSIIVARKMQFGCVLNSSDFTNSALTNSIRQLNYAPDKLIYYWDLQDSLLITPDTRMFP